MRHIRIPLVIGLFATGCSEASIPEPNFVPAAAKSGGGQTCPGTPGQTTNIFIVPSAVSVQVGKSSDLKVTNQSGVEIADCNLKWSSAKASLMTVSTAGVVTGIATGSTLVTATTVIAKRTLTATAQVTVTADIDLATLRLVIARTSGSDLRIFTVNADGSNETFLANGVTPMMRAAVLLARGPFNDNGVYRMNATGGDRQLLLSGYGPELAPGNARFTSADPIVSCVNEGRAIRVADLSGANIQTVLPCSNSAAKWSPDGSRLVTTREGNVVIVNADGTNPSTLTSGATGFTPDWSPDGQRILYSGIRPTETVYSIYSMETDGSNLQRIGSLGPYDKWHPDYHPTLGLILYLSGSPKSSEVWIMRADGTNPVKVMSCTSCAFDARWVR